MHVIYFGIISRPEDIGKIGITSVAGNKMQYNLLKYLSRNEDLKIDVVSYHPHKPFRKSKKLFVKTEKEKLFDNVDAYQVGYINLPIIKQWLVSLKTKKMAKKLLKDDTVLFAYDIYPTQGTPFIKLSKKVNGKAVCLLADLSTADGLKIRGFKKLLRKAYDKRTMKNIKKCNYYISLNENAMKEYAPHSKYLIMDGGIEPKEFENRKGVWDGKEKNIIYTGALVDYSGIMHLIGAIDKVDNPEIVLDIYGDGALKDEIKKIAESNPRIRYHGRVSNEEAIKAQQSAWLLANPRPVENSIAKVTFPSKIFEYLMSGRPVMTTRLNGFSSDYDELLFWVEDGSCQGLAESINAIDKKSNEELHATAENAKAYLLKNKTWEINAQKVYEFLKNEFEK